MWSKLAGIVMLSVFGLALAYLFLVHPGNDDEDWPIGY